MKIRAGFVSNSSSSSFMIYGVDFHTDPGSEIWEILRGKVIGVLVNNEDLKRSLGIYLDNDELETNLDFGYEIGDFGMLFGLEDYLSNISVSRSSRKVYEAVQIVGSSYDWALMIDPGEIPLDITLSEVKRILWDYLTNFLGIDEALLRAANKCPGDIEFSYVTLGY